MGTTTEASQPHESSGKTSVKSADAVTATATATAAGQDGFRGVNLAVLKAHSRFLLLTLLASCSLIEYGFDHGMVGSFQAMVGFLKVFGYEDPKVPAGWVSL